MNNQYHLSSQPVIPQMPPPLTSPLSNEPKHKKNIWKIVGIILIIIIGFFSLLVWYGSSLEDQDQNLSNQDNNQINMTTDQNNQNSTDNYLKMEQDVQEYRAFAEKVISELGNGNTEYLKKNLSPNLVAANSQNSLEQVFLPAAKDLFDGFSRIDDSVTIQPSTDAYGNEGYSFAMTALYKNGAEINFKIYIIKEDGRLVVGNIVR